MSAILERLSQKPSGPDTGGSNGVSGKTKVEQGA
jgi:hypothetical protein